MVEYEPLGRLFHESSSATALLDEGGWILEANESFRLVFESISGRSVDSLKEPLVEFFREREAFRFSYHFARLATGAARSATVDTALRSANGETRWVQIRAWAIPKVDNAPPNKRGPFVACTMEDQTERRQEERRLLEAKENAEKATETKSQFLANMSHEIRTPIQTIIGMTELLQETNLNREQEEYARQVKFSAEVLLSLINDILDYSKIEANKLQLEKLDFELETTVEQAVDLISLEAHKKGLEITVDVAFDTPVLIKGDPVRLRQIIVNLVKNAVKFTREGGIVVSVRRTEIEGREAIEIDVADTGIGVHPELRPKLFTTFYQGDASTTRRFGGTGLGLAISRHLVEMMGGSIGMRPNEGEGSIFYVILPVERSEFNAPRPEPGLKQDERFLVVDDRVQSRKTLVSYLTAYGYTHVGEAASGQEAMAALETAAKSGKPYDLCFIDMVMPGMDGWRLAAEINKDRAVNAARLVLMVPQGTLGADAKMTLLRWFNAYINKPIKRHDLAEAILAAAEGAIDLEGAATAEDPAQVFQSTQDQPPPEAGCPPPETASFGPAPQGACLEEVAGTDQGRAGSLLVVEDHPVNQKLFALILERLCFRVVIANDGIEALEAAKDQRFDLIFMDIQMPRMNGYEATTKLRASGFRRPIIAVTASALVDEQERCAQAGISDILVKPFRRKEIEAVLNKWLPEGGTPTEDEGVELLEELPEAEPDPEDGLEEGPEAGDEDEAFDGKPAIAAAELLDTFMGKWDIVLPLLRRFMERTEVQIAGLPTLLRREDWEVLRREAHTIKGSALNLRASDLGNRAAVLENAAKDQNREASGVALRGLGPAYNRFKQAALELLRTEGRGTP